VNKDGTSVLMLWTDIVVGRVKEGGTHGLTLRRRGRDIVCPSYMP